MKVEADMPTFQRLTKCLAEIYPQATVELLASDPALRDLGFVHEIPCTIEIHATQEQINEIKEMAIQFEIDAINSADGTYCPDNSEAYLNYEKYGWLFDFFYGNQE